MRLFLLTALVAVAEASRGCPRGKFIAGGGECQACPKGKWQSQANKSKCWDCPQGHFQPRTGLHSCYQCPTGQYQDTTGTASCKKCNTCDKGSFGVTAGVASKSKAQCKCSYCKAGRYAPAKSTACHACPTGRFNPLTASYSCYYCPAGKFQDKKASTQCSSCAVGTTSPKNSKSADSCAKPEAICELGFYRAPGKDGSTSCQPCPAGMFGQIVSKAYGGHCFACPAGTSQSQTGKLTCNKCAPGLVSSNDKKMCHSPEIYKVKFGLYSSADAHSVAASGWTLPTLSYIAAMKDLLIEDYKLHGGFHVLAGWTPSSCCVSMAGGHRLTVNGISYAYPRSGTGLMCGHGRVKLNANQVLGLTFQHSQQLKDFATAVKLGGSAGHGMCAKKLGETNPALYMHLEKATPSEVAASPYCHMVGLRRFCLPAPPARLTPAPTPALPKVIADFDGSKDDWLNNHHSTMHQHNNNFHQIMQMQSMIEKGEEVGITQLKNGMLASADRNYKPRATRKCCNIQCGKRSKDRAACEKGCKLWIGHTSLNWESDKRWLLKNQCDHMCEFVAQKKVTFTHTDLERGEESGCKDGCVMYDECSYHTSMPARAPVKKIMHSILELERSLGQ